MQASQIILEAYRMGDLDLQNRMVMAPMTRSRADNAEHAPSAIHVKYYQQRASAGLIITEGSQVSPMAVGYINTPGMYSEAQTEGWKAVTAAVHEAGGKIFAQLWHVGRISHPDFHGGELPLAPDAINPNAKSYTPQGFKDTVTPKAMTLEDIRQTIADFKNAAEHAKIAGFDGVEIHSSNGYLFHQFFNRSSNQRSDQYGGSIENRNRFFFEVLDAVAEVFPQQRIGARFNPSLHHSFGMIADEETIPGFDAIISRLDAEYKLAYIHLSEPFTDVSAVPFLVQEVARHYRPLYKGTIIVNSNFDQQKANDVINAGYADLVSFGKLFISNPDLPARFATGAPLEAWNQDTFYTPGEKGYTDYKALEEMPV